MQCITEQEVGATWGLCAEYPPKSQQPTKVSSYKTHESRNTDFSNSHMTSCC